MITNDELDRLQAVCDAATPGPWEFLWPLHIVTKKMDMSQVATGDVETICEAVDETDGEFLVAARTALPALIAEVRHLRTIFSPYTLYQVREILVVFEDYADDLAWSLSSQGEAAFWVPCNDTFAPIADSEKIAPDDQDILALRQARRDADGHTLWPILWVARKRQQPPMPSVLDRWRQATWAQSIVPLFEQAGNSHE